MKRVIDLCLEITTQGDCELLDIQKRDLSFDEKIALIKVRQKVLFNKTSKERYNEYLKSPQWKAKKNLVLKRANYCCEGCGASKVSLEVHHLTYERKGMELLTDLVAFCGRCHELAHERVETKKEIEWYTYLNMITHDIPQEETEEEKLERIIEGL